jgi:hypothetical protein
LKRVPSQIPGLSAGLMRNLQGQGRVFEKGDCIYFDSDVEHSGVATGENGCKCFSVIYSQG